MEHLQTLAPEIFLSPIVYYEDYSENVLIHHERKQRDRIFLNSQPNTINACSDKMVILLKFWYP